jgi:hypothetical protein
LQTTKRKNLSVADAEVIPKGGKNNGSLHRLKKMTRSNMKIDYRAWQIAHAQRSLIKTYVYFTYHCKLKFIDVLLNNIFSSFSLIWHLTVL